MADKGPFSAVITGTIKIKTLATPYAMGAHVLRVIGQMQIVREVNYQTATALGHRRHPKELVSRILNRRQARLLLRGVKANSKYEEVDYTKGGKCDTLHSGRLRHLKIELKHLCAKYLVANTKDLS